MKTTPTFTRTLLNGVRVLYVLSTIAIVLMTISAIFFGGI
jgi:hypothetical protein